jgi:hypothetical protein
MVESRGTWNLLNQENGWENAPQQPFIGYKRIQTCCVMQHRFKATVGLQSSRSLSRLLASNWFYVDQLEHASFLHSPEKLYVDWWKRDGQLKAKRRILQVVFVLALS